MPVKEYVSAGNQIIYETDYTSPSGAILTYGRDALGSVVAGYDAATSAVFTVQYKPYGEIITNTGSISSQRFLWAGSWGYRYTSGSAISQYVRARHLISRMGMWNTLDMLWPNEMPYGYVNGRVTNWNDYSGKSPIQEFGCNSFGKPNPISGFKDLCDKLNKCLNKPQCKDNLINCIRKGGGNNVPPEFIEKVLTQLIDACVKNPDKTCIFCMQGFFGGKVYDACRKSCANSNARTVKAGPKPIKPSDPPIFDDLGLISLCGANDVPDEDYDCNLALTEYAFGKGAWNGKVLICDGADKYTVLHELIHVIGIRGNADKHNQRNDFIYDIENCLRRNIR